MLELDSSEMNQISYEHRTRFIYTKKIHVQIQVGRRGKSYENI